MRTGCGSCGKVYRSPEKAQEHYLKTHETIKRVAGGTINGRFVRTWPKDTPGLYVEGTEWAEYALPYPPKQGVSGL